MSAHGLHFFCMYALTLIDLRRYLSATRVPFGILDRCPDELWYNVLYRPLRWWNFWSQIFVRGTFITNATVIITFSSAILVVRKLLCGYFVRCDVTQTYWHHQTSFAQCQFRVFCRSEISNRQVKKHVTFYWVKYTIYKRVIKWHVFCCIDRKSIQEHFILKITEQF